MWPFSLSFGWKHTVSTSLLWLDATFLFCKQNLYAVLLPESLCVSWRTDYRVECISFHLQGHILWILSTCIVYFHIYVRWYLAFCGDADNNSNIDIEDSKCPTFGLSDFWIPWNVSVFRHIVYVFVRVLVDPWIQTKWGLARQNSCLYTVVSPVVKDFTE